MEWTQDEFVISDDPARLDVGIIFEMLSQTYWAAGRPRSEIETALEHSLCLGLYKGARQVGFSRAVTDYATFTWLCDVIVHPDFRRQGLGKWMVRCLIEHPRLQTRSQALATRDAHGLYERFGFTRKEWLRRYTEGSPYMA